MPDKMLDTDEVARLVAAVIRSSGDGNAARLVGELIHDVYWRGYRDARDNSGWLVNGFEAAQQRILA